MRQALFALALALASVAGQAAPGRSPPRARTPASAPIPVRFDRCFLAAGQRYGVSPLLLKAIGRQESGLDPDAFHRNADGSSDIGLMQINSSWLPTLARHGVREADLQVPCVNILVGAWILGSNFRTMGPTVEALGAYNARDPVKRLAYARQVLRQAAALREALSPPDR